MAESLSGKVTIITGASRGLGLAIANNLATAGAWLVLAGRDHVALNELATSICASGGKALAMPTDLGRRQDIQTLIDETRRQLGPVEILINNAGVGWYKPFSDYSAEEIDEVIQVNLTGLIHCCHTALPDMIQARKGIILNIASDLGRRVIPNMAAYVAAKHGVLGFSGSLLREVKDKGIKVLTLNPGIIDTGFGGSEAGSREETWSLKPEAVAEIVQTMLTQPPYVMMDEVTIHPMYQEL